MTFEPMTLENKTILITGASRGIGRATAEICRAQGARVLSHASRISEHTDEDFLIQDFTQTRAGARLFQAALERVGRIDGVVNNAGIYLPSSLTGEDWQSGWEKTMAVNVQAPADICRAAITHYRKSNGGQIVNIASRAGHRGDGPDHAAYAASKGAVLAMTKTWARGLADENIYLYALAPGWVETRMAPQDIAARKKAVKDIPMGRVAMPQEVGHMIAFLLSGRSHSATGATFDINGASYVR